MSLLTWPLIALRLALVGGVPLLTLVTIPSNALAAVCLVAAWAPQLAAAFTPPQGRGVVADMLLLGLTCVQTQRVLLAFCTDASLDLYWLVPVEAAALYTSLRHLAGAAPFAPAAGLLAPTATYSESWLRALLAVVVLTTAAMCYVAGSAGAAALLCVEGAIGASLVLYVWHYAAASMAWSGGSSILLLYLYMRLSTLALESWPVACAGLASTALAGLVAIGAVRSNSTRFARFLALLAAPLEAAHMLLTSRDVYQIAIVACATVVAHSAGQPWFDSLMVFPPLLHQICYDAKYVIDTFVQPFYVITSDPDFQRTVEVALPQVATVRGSVYRVINQAYFPLTECSSGKSYRAVPLDDVMSFLSFLPPLATLAAMAAQLFPGGGAFVAAPWFWAVSLLGGAACTAVCHVASDASSLFWHSLFPSSAYTRVYTDAGAHALVAQLAFVACTLALFLLASRADVAAADVAPAQAAWQPPDRWHSSSRDQPELAPMLPATAARGVLEDVLKRATRAAWLRASTICFALSVLALVALATQSGPIRSLSIAKNTTRQPDWVVLTPIDRVQAIAGGVEGMLLGDELRLVLLANMIALYGVGELRCITCICIDLAAIKRGWDSFTGLFHVRRLLEHKPDSTHTGARSLAAADDTVIGSIQTAMDILLAPRCAKPSCGLTQICVFDMVLTLVKTVVDLLMTAIQFVSRLLIHEVVMRIPFAHVLDLAISRIEDVAAYVEFELLDHAGFPVTFGFDSHLLSVARPSFASVSPLVWLAVALAAACAVYVLFFASGGYSASAAAGLELSASAAAASAASAAFVVARTVSALLREEGYDVRVEWGDNVHAYAIAGCGLLLAVCLRLSEANSREPDL